MVISPKKKMRLKVWLSLDEIISPALADTWRIAGGKQRIGHFFHI
jgi:hypothetical protein